MKLPLAFRGLLSLTFSVALTAAILLPRAGNLAAMLDSDQLSALQNIRGGFKALNHRINTEGLAPTPVDVRTNSAQTDFRRLNRFLRGGKDATLPGNLAVLLGWGDGRADIWVKRRSISERRDSDGVVVARYAADVSGPGGDNYVLLSQVVEGDSTISFLFNKDGALVRTFELTEIPGRPDLPWRVEEIFGGVYDNLGYQTWRLILTVVPPEVSDPISAVPTA